MTLIDIPHRFFVSGCHVAFPRTANDPQRGYVGGGVDRTTVQMRKRGRWVCLLLAVVLASLTGSDRLAAGVVRTSDARLAVAFDAATGSLVELADPRSGFNQIADNSETMGLWRFELADGAAVQTLSAENAGVPRIESLPGDAVGQRLLWERVPLRGRTDFVRVEVTVRPGVPLPGLSRWEIAIAKPAALKVHHLRFPRVGHLRERSEERLAVPYSLGMMTRHPRVLLSGNSGKGVRQVWESPHRLSLQCVTYYGEGGPGFVALCEDPLGRHKGFAFWGDGKKGLHFEVVHTPEQEAAGLTEYRLPYRVVLGAFTGDWMTAAELYRATPAAREIAARGRLARGLVPKWIEQTGLWVWNRGRSEQVLGPAEAMRRHLGTPVSVLWHWWHECPYDAGFPEYLPPREGSADFREAVRKARENDVRVLLYMNQRLWGTTTGSWKEEGAEAFAVRGPKGTVETTIYQKRLAAPMATMCLGTRFWRDKYAGLAEAVLCGLGADGVYMDQTGLPGNCHNPDHGHSLGIGAYWHEGLSQLTRDIRRRDQARGTTVLAGEFVGEPWIGDLDVALALDISAERIGAASKEWERIPFFPAVYHDAALAFGSYASLVYPPYDEKWPQEDRPDRALTPLDAKYDRQFRLEQARSFAWGLQPMVANFVPEQVRSRPASIDFLVRAAKTRRNALKYLQHGTWLRPPAAEIAAREIELVQVSIYNPPRETKRTYPEVLSGAWRAKDGAVGIALANLGDAPLDLSLPVDFAAYGLPSRCAVYRIDHRGRRSLGHLDRSTPGLRAILEPADACVLELAAEAGPAPQSR